MNAPELVAILQPIELQVLVDNENASVDVADSEVEEATLSVGLLVFVNVVPFTTTELMLANACAYVLGTKHITANKNVKTRTLAREVSDIVPGIS